MRGIDEGIDEGIEVWKVCLAIEDGHIYTKLVIFLSFWGNCCVKFLYRYQGF